MNATQLQSIRSVLGPMTSEAKCREVFEAVLLSVREPDWEVQLAGINSGRSSLEAGTTFAAMIDALLAE